MTYDEIISKVAEENGLSSNIVSKVYKAYWRTVRDYISSLPLKDDLSEGSLSRLRPNINVPSLGKLYVSAEKYNAMKKSYRMYISDTNK